MPQPRPTFQRHRSASQTEAGEWWQTRDNKLARKLPKGTSSKALKWWQNKDTKGMTKSFEGQEEAIHVKGLKSKKARDSVAQDIRMMKRGAQHGGWPERSAMRGLVKGSGGKGSRYESIQVFSSLAMTEALEQVKAALECGCIDKMEWAAEALALAMCEAGCPPMQHINQKLGRCTPIPSELHKAMKSAHEVSTKSKKPSDHEMAHKKMTDVAQQLHGAGFHQLAGLHAARAHAHKLASAN